MVIKRAKIAIDNDHSQLLCGKIVPKTPKFIKIVKNGYFLASLLLIYFPEIFRTI
jgi:hypothetical protein